jgi:hypothetical protein
MSRSEEPVAVRPVEFKLLQPSVERSEIQQHPQKKPLGV